MINIENQLGKWYPVLRQEFSKPYMVEIGKRLSSVTELCPSPENIFKAYELTPPDDVKVCILGLDPYINGEAHGLCFSCETGKVPPSLRIMFTELVDCGLSTERRVDANLTDWARQGVFLLNTVLTTVRKQTLAHGAWGWQNFTGLTLKYLAESPQPIVFLIWGKDAMNSAHKYIVPYKTANKEVLYACHPAAQTYGRTKFVENRHFTAANDFLLLHGLKPIQWHNLQSPSQMTEQ